jgi:hypothetical protein
VVADGWRGLVDFRRDLEDSGREPLARRVRRPAVDRPLTHGCERYGETMGRQAGVVLYVLALVVVVVGVDFLFFRHRFWERLMVNVGIVLVFGAFSRLATGRSLSLAPRLPEPEPARRHRHD